MLTYLVAREELNESLTGLFDPRGGGESASAWSIELTYLAARNDELNESLTGLFDPRGGGESASAWSVARTYLTVRDDALTH